MKHILATTRNIIIITLFGLVFSTVSTYAQDLAAFDLLGISDINQLLGIITTFLTNLALPLATLVIIWGGYQYFLGGFDQKANGKKAITSAVIGLALVYGVGFITTTVKSVLTPADGAKGPFNFQPIVDLLDNLSGNLINLAAFVAVLVIVWGGYQFFFSSLPGGKANGRETIQNGILGLVAVLLANPIITLIKSIVSNPTTEKLFDSQPVIKFIISFLNGFLIPVSTVVTVVFFVVGGYYYLTSGANDGNAKKGRDIIQNAIIGLIIVLTAFTLTQILIYVVQGFKFA
jgi:Type IV secretion system pilin